MRLITDILRDIKKGRLVDEATAKLAETRSRGRRDPEARHPHHHTHHQAR